MKWLGLVAVVVAVWILLRSRTVAAAQGTSTAPIPSPSTPDELQQLLPPGAIESSVSSYVEGQPYNLSDASSFADSSRNRTDWAAYSPPAPWLMDPSIPPVLPGGIDPSTFEAPLAPARPSGG